MRPPVPSCVPSCVPPSPCSYRMTITSAIGQKHSRHPIRADENGAYHTVRTYLPRSHIRITSTRRCRYGGSPFLISPAPSCRLSLICSLQMFPRPQVGGRAYLHRFAWGGRRRNPPASNHHARSLTAFVRYRHDTCLLTERMAGRDKRDEKNQDERRDGRRDDRMERPQVQEKRTGCRHPASLPACLLAAYQFLRSRFGYRASFP